MGVDPGTLAIASLVLGGIGTTFQVAGQFQQQEAAQAQAKAQRDQQSFNAAVARNNAIFAQRQADDALRRGRIQERRQRVATQQLLARQRAEFAGRGLDIGIGTPLDVTSDTARTAELDALTIRSNAEREALGFRTQAINFRTQEQLAQLRSLAPGPPGPGLAVAGTVLTGASTATERFSEFRQQGIL